MNAAEVDHRRLQRVLFRMFLDPGFAASMFADASLRRAEGLSDVETSWILAAGPAAIGADKDQKRRGQVLGNVQIEYKTSIAVACTLGVGDAWADEFLASPEFHEAITHDRRLPHAFGVYLDRRARKTSSLTLLDAIALDRAMVEARRFDRPNAAGSSRGLTLSPAVRLVEVGDGVFESLTTLIAALDRGERPVPPRECGTARETIMLVGKNSSPHRLREVAAERLEPAVADLLRHAAAGLDESRLELIARMHAAEPGDLAEFAESLVADGVLLRARDDRR